MRFIIYIFIYEICLYGVRSWKGKMGMKKVLGYWEVWDVGNERLFRE